MLGAVGMGAAMNGLAAQVLASQVALPDSNVSSVSGQKSSPAGVRQFSDILKQLSSEQPHQTAGERFTAGVAATTALTTFGIPASLVASSFSDLGKMGSLDFTQSISSLVKKGVMDAAASRAATATSYGHENPIKAALAVRTAGIVSYYTSPKIKDALVQLGDSTLSAKRAVIDHGSGAIKGSVVTYNPFNNKMIGEEISLGKYTISLSKTMKKEGSTKHLDEMTMEKGVEALRQLVDAALKEGVALENIVITATAWARAGAENTPSYIKRVEAETGVPLFVLSQEEEGKLGQIAAASRGVNVGVETILDTGGGSLQLTHGKDVHGLAMGSATFAEEFKNFMIGDDLERMQWSKGAFARLKAEGRKRARGGNTADTGDVLQGLKEAIKNKDGGVKGIGDFYGGVLKFAKLLSPESMAPETMRLTLQDLKIAMEKLEGLSAQEIGAMLEEVGIPKQLAGIVTINSPLMYGIMKAFDLKHIEVVNTNSGAGGYFYGRLWKRGA